LWRFSASKQVTTVAPTAQTVTGTSLETVVPFPSSPLPFEPQATTVPPSSSAPTTLNEQRFGKGYRVTGGTSTERSEHRGG
jgi:hypothetical protein